MVGTAIRAAVVGVLAATALVAPGTATTMSVTPAVTVAADRDDGERPDGDDGGHAGAHQGETPATKRTGPRRHGGEGVEAGGRRVRVVELVEHLSPPLPTAGPDRRAIVRGRVTWRS